MVSVKVWDGDDRNGSEGSHDADPQLIRVRFRLAAFSMVFERVPRVIPQRLQDEDDRCLPPVQVSRPVAGVENQQHPNE